MTLTKLAAGVGMIALLTTPAFAGPVEMTDDGLAQVVGGETDFSGGVIQAGDGDVNISTRGEVLLDGNAQEGATGVEVFNSADSAIGTAVNISVIQNGAEGAVGASSFADTISDTSQVNEIVASRTQNAGVDTLTNFTTVTNTGTFDTDNTTSSVSATQAQFEIDVLGLIEVSVPNNTDIAVAGEAFIDLNTGSIDVGPFEFSGPGLEVGSEGDPVDAAFCFGGGCTSTRGIATSSTPAVAAANVVEAEGTGLRGEVISLGNGDISKAADDEVSLSGAAQANATGVKIVNAASSAVGTGSNLWVNRCCGGSFAASTRTIRQSNVITGRF